MPKHEIAHSFERLRVLQQCLVMVLDCPGSADIGPAVFLAGEIGHAISILEKLMPTVCTIEGEAEEDSRARWPDQMREGAEKPAPGDDVKR